MIQNQFYFDSYWASQTGNAMQSIHIIMYTLFYPYRQHIILYWGHILHQLLSRVSIRCRLHAFSTSLSLFMQESLVCLAYSSLEAVFPWYNYVLSTWQLQNKNMTDERSGGHPPVVIVWTNREWWVVLQPALICKRVLIKALTERDDKNSLSL